MNSRRTVILIVAVVVGAIAAFGLLNYVRNVEGSVYDNAAPEQIWVVRTPIPKGTPAEQAIDQNLIYQTEIPATFRPSTAIVDPQLELAGLVAVTDLPANAPLVTGNFVSTNVVNTGITDRLEEKGARHGHLQRRQDQGRGLPRRAWRLCQHLDGQGLRGHRGHGHAGSRCHRQSR